jgi:hypothetical protein
MSPAPGTDTIRTTLFRVFWWKTKTTGGKSMLFTPSVQKKMRNLTFQVEMKLRDFYPFCFLSFMDVNTPNSTNSAMKDLYVQAMGAIVCTLKRLR